MQAPALHKWFGVLQTKVAAGPTVKLFGRALDLGPAKRVFIDQVRLR